MRLRLIGLSRLSLLCGVIPAAVCFHENRLVFGGTLAQPDTIWMSQIGKYFNFDVGDAEDTDSFDLTAATGQVNEIRYMISNRDLQVFTGSGELYIPTYLNKLLRLLTPRNQKANTIRY